nr:hypothetical protein Hi04_10k_c2220_00031 [uncultured bacterium]
MADFVSDLAAKCGINNDMAQKGLGAILAFLKDKLPTEAFTKVSATVPGADGMISAFQSAPEASGGMLDAVKGAVGKLFGGADALAGLTKLGFSTEQLTSFVTKVLEFFKGRLPTEVMKQITGLLPIPETASA